jgi:hypothetical protein
MVRRPGRTAQKTRSGYSTLKWRSSLGKMWKPPALSDFHTDISQIIPRGHTVAPPEKVHPCKKYTPPDPPEACRNRRLPNTDSHRKFLPEKRPCDFRCHTISGFTRFLVPRAISGATHPWRTLGLRVGCGDSPRRAAQISRGDSPRQASGDWLCEVMSGLSHRFRPARSHGLSARGLPPNGIEVLWSPVKRRVKTSEGEAGMAKRC